MARRGLQPPSGCACGGVLAGWRVCRRTHPRRDLTRRICPNAAAQQRSELCGAPRKHPDAGCPFAQRRGRRLWGALLCLLSCRAQERRSPAGASPGLRPQPKHKDSKRRIFATAVQPTSRQKQCRDSEPRPQGLALATAPVATNVRSAFSRAFKRRSFSNPTRTMIFCPLDRLCSCGSANS